MKRSLIPGGNVSLGFYEAGAASRCLTPTYGLTGELITAEAEIPLLPIFPAITVRGGAGNEKTDGESAVGIKKCLEFLTATGERVSAADAVAAAKLIGENLGCRLTVSVKKVKSDFSDAQNYAGDRRILVCLLAFIMLNAGKSAEIRVSDGEALSVTADFPGDADVAVRLSRADLLMRDSGIPFGWSRGGDGYSVFFSPCCGRVQTEGSVKQEPIIAG